MRLTPLRKLLATLGPASVVLLLGVLAYQAARATSARTRWVDHTHQVIEQLARLELGLTDAELGERGFLLLGDSTSRLRHYEGVRRARTALGELGRLTVDNAMQQAALATLRPLVALRLTHFDSAVSQRDPTLITLAERQRLLATARQLADSARTVTRRMEAREAVLLEQRDRDQQAALRRTVLIVIVGTVAAAILALLTNRWLVALAAAEARALHDLTEQSAMLEETAAELEASNEELRTTGEELAEASAQAEAERRRVSGILESISDAFIALDRDWRFVFVNDEAERLVQRTHDALIGQRLWDAFPIARGTRVQGELERAVRDGVTVSLEEYFGGAERWFAIRAYPSVDGLSVYFQDVTQRRRAEVALAESERRFRAVQEASPDGFMLFRALREDGEPSGQIVDFVCVYVNASAERLLDGLAREMYGHRLLATVPDALSSGFFAANVAVVETGEVLQSERQSSAFGGRVFRVTTVRVDDGVGVSFADVTARVRAEANAHAALEAESRARADAETANRAKSDFLAVMSHELRTPLNAIAGYAELLEMGVRGAVNDVQREDLRRIQRSQRRLLGLVNDVLNFARLEAGRVEMQLSRVELPEVLRAAESLIAPQLEAKSLRYVAATCDDVPPLRADRDKLEQILLNLLGNAAKFTPDGGDIHVDCTVEPGRVRLGVRDSGRGIPADRLETIFEPFVQIDRHLTPESQQGVGLGLAISRDLARAMGGELTATSEHDAGATFELTLPLAAT